MTPEEIDLVCKSLRLFARTHEREHSCADATRARALEERLSTDRRIEDAS